MFCKVKFSIATSSNDGFINQPLLLSRLHLIQLKPYRKLQSATI